MIKVETERAEAFKEFNKIKKDYSRIREILKKRDKTIADLKQQGRTDSAEELKGYRAKVAKLEALQETLKNKLEIRQWEITEPLNN
jgi:hypothetical protein